MTGTTWIGEKFSFQILGRNAYEYANFKEIRDANYWARNIFTMTPFTYVNSFILRPDPGLLALIFKQGYSDIGYPSTLFKKYANVHCNRDGKDIS